MKKQVLVDRLGRLIFFLAALLSLLSIIAIFGFLIKKSLPFFQSVDPGSFLFGRVWLPDRYDRYHSRLAGSYGVFPMLTGTLLSSTTALLVGGTLGYFLAIFTVFFCPRPLRGLFRAAVGVLAGIPSVVYGFFGISFLLPLLSRVTPTSGAGLVATALILGLMILPTVVALYQTALEAVPKSDYAGAIALGVTHAQAVFGIVAPAARSGFLNALTLSLGRALGETMAVMMVAGNAPTFIRGPFRSFRTLTANIAMEMGYAGEVQEGALIASGVVLLGLLLLVHLFLERSAGSLRNASQKRRSGSFFSNKSVKIYTAAAVGSGIVLAVAILLLLGFLLYRGLPAWLSSPTLLLGKFQFGGDSITLLPSLVTTLMAAVAALLPAIPVGVMSAVYLHEYAERNTWLVRLLRRSITLLAGVPSIVYGLFGMVAFLPLLGGSSSILAGSMTVAILLLPTVIRTTEESLAAVESGQREGSFALGATKVRTLLRIVLPAALPGILSATLLSLCRVIGESAPFLYTMGSVLTALPKSYLDSGTTLAVALYSLSGEGWHQSEAYAAAVMLIVLVLGLNILTAHAAQRMQRKRPVSERRPI